MKQVTSSRTGVRVFVCRGSLWSGGCDVRRPVSGCVEQDEPTDRVAAFVAELLASAAICRSMIVSSGVAVAWARLMMRWPYRISDSRAGCVQRSQMQVGKQWDIRDISSPCHAASANG